MLIGNNFIFYMHLANSSWMQKYLKPKIHRLFNKIHSRRRIYAWNPHQASPTYIKASCQTNLRSREDYIQASTEIEKQEMSAFAIRALGRYLLYQYRKHSMHKPLSCAISIVFQYPASHQKNFVTYTNINIVFTSMESDTRPYSSC